MQQGKYADESLVRVNVGVTARPAPEELALFAKGQSSAAEGAVLLGLQGQSGR